MAGMNARLDPGIETVFLMASEGVHFISSRFVKEIALLGGDISPFVSTPVIARIAAKVSERGAAARLASGSGSVHD
jgi:pantetheine-phosphate adenylyltransferase